MGESYVIAVIIILCIIIFDSIHKHYLQEVEEVLPRGINPNLYYYLTKRFGKPISDDKIFIWIETNFGYTQIILSDILIATIPFDLFAGYGKVEFTRQAYNKRLAKLLLLDNHLQYNMREKTLMVKANTWEELIDLTYRTLYFSLSGLGKSNSCKPIEIEQEETFIFDYVKKYT